MKKKDWEIKTYKMSQHDLSGVPIARKETDYKKAWGMLRRNLNQYCGRPNIKLDPNAFSNKMAEILKKCKEQPNRA